MYHNCSAKIDYVSLDPLLRAYSELGSGNQPTLWQVSAVTILRGRYPHTVLIQVKLLIFFLKRTVSEKLCSVAEVTK